MNHFINKSESVIKNIDEPIHISIIIPVYDEINRFKTPLEHHNGEDFLNVKIDQCNELFAGKNNITYNLLLVDDGCPNHTGKYIENYINNNKLTNCKVIYLEYAIKIGIFNNLDNVNNSRKGGAIYYGLHYSINETPINDKKHIIIYSDADISVDLRQTGLLIEKILEGYTSCIACRHLPESITIKEGARSTRGKIHAYYWKQLFEEINYLSDTQTGFKAFDSSIINKLLENTCEYKFCFDIEILLKANKVGKIQQIPIYWVDSPAESKTTNLEYYLEILQSMAKLYTIFVEDKTDDKDKISEYLKKLTIEKYKYLLNNFNHYNI